NMGPLDQVLDMLPGMGGGGMGGMGGLGDIQDEMDGDFADVTERRMEKYRAILDSMTEKEMENPRSVGES
ncbi:MAG: hypothetical protein SV760_01070, partial [Halobacteria archaeon]|nr:hypothetical protein [Halobacteria archaeon]